MANISSFIFLKLLVTWGEFQLVLLLYVSCGWALVSLLMGFSYYAAWNKDKLVAGLGWVFSGPSIEAPINGSMVESSIGSPLINGDHLRVPVTRGILRQPNAHLSNLKRISD
ncbi:unnamed protein product [Brassica oleracea]